MLGRKPRQKQKTRAPHPSFAVEPLEPRQLLAGNITAQVVSGNLVITGDALGNDIKIDQSGLLPDQFRVSSGASATAINGLGAPVVFSGILGGLLIDLQDGADTVKLADCVVPLDVLNNGGNGDNTVELDHATIRRSLTINGGTGLDTLELSHASVTGNVFVQNGDGGSSTTIEDASTIGGWLWVINRAGADNFTIDESNVGRQAVIDNGDGGSSTLLKESSIGD